MPDYRAIAAYYDAEHADVPMLREDVPFFLGQLPAGRQDVLELCVGTARAAIPLARAGHRVVGVDHDPDLLALAAAKRAAAGLTPAELALLPGDVRRLALGRRRFDWACLFFNTLNAFPAPADLDAVLTRARRHLRPGGRFWVDTFNPDLTLLAAGHSPGLAPRTFYVPELARTVMATTDLRTDAAAGTQLVTYHYTWFTPAGRPRRQQARFTLAYLFPRELRLVLDRNGLPVEQMWGNYDGSPVTGGSPRLIACCRATGRRSLRFTSTRPRSRIRRAC